MMGGGWATRPTVDSLEAKDKRKVKAQLQTEGWPPKLQRKVIGEGRVSHLQAGLRMSGSALSPPDDEC
jgi:hypothetical protein